MPYLGDYSGRADPTECGPIARDKAAVIAGENFKERFSAGSGPRVDDSFVELRNTRASSYPASNPLVPFKSARARFIAYYIAPRYAKFSCNINNRVVAATSFINP